MGKQRVVGRDPRVVASRKGDHPKGTSPAIVKKRAIKKTGMKKKKFQSSITSKAMKLLTLQNLRLEEPKLDHQGRVVRSGSDVTPALTSYTSSAPTAATSELRYRYTRLFDYKGDAGGGPVCAVLIDQYQGILTGSAGFGEGQVYTRIEKVKAWVLPKISGVDAAANTFVALFSVPAATPATIKPDGTATAELASICQQSTVVKSDFNVDWVKIGEYDATKAFDTTMLEPYVYTGTPPEGTTAYHHNVLFELALIDPESGVKFAGPAQVMFEVEVSAPVPCSTTYKGGELYHTLFATPITSGTVGSAKAFGELLGARNVY